VYVRERFQLSTHTKNLIRSLTPRFGYDGFGELIFYRTYSREKSDGGQENWADCVIRVTEGTFSIRKDWYIKNFITWDEEYWQKYAVKFARTMFDMWWLPSGRGLWAMGTEFVYERGSMALSNCAFTLLTNEFSDDIAWLMDALMHGVGVGFEAERNDDLELYEPKGSYDYVIPDTREGWCDSVKTLIDSFRYPYRKKPRFIYDKLRPAGAKIKGFGGIASGPGPLRWYHQKIEEYCHYYMGDMSDYDSVMLKTDLACGAGCCTVAGNVRRSAELAAGKITDQTFMDLKNYDIYPYREDIGWMTNNSVLLKDDSDFEMMGEIAKRVIKNGEPGFINMRNLPFGRIGKKKPRLRKDKARGFNPCGEQPLEHREICIVDETFPTVCPDEHAWYEACEFANFYAATVALLPTHQPSTNRVVAKNRRIGISITDFTGWKQAVGLNKVIKFMRKGYKLIRKHNRKLANEAGVCESLRVTNVKPGGTIPKLPGKTPGAGYPTFDYTLRRVRVQQNCPFHTVLVNANIPYETDAYSMNTDVFSYPIHQGPAPPAYKISVWEQALNLVTMQREWADNAVSNTIYFKPMWALQKNFKKYNNAARIYIDKLCCDTTVQLRIEKAIESENEILFDDYKIKIKRNKDHTIRDMNIYKYDPNHEENCLEAVLSHIAPLTKSATLLPHSTKGAYIQMPEEGITEQEYYELKAQILPIDWTKYSGSDGIDEKYCEGPHCQLPVHA